MTAFIKLNNITYWFSVVTLCLLMLHGCEQPAHAETIQGYDIQAWATAIKHAENSKNWPYGIMAHYKLTTPRQACINTVRHYYHNWLNIGQPGEFLGYLQRYYAPLKVKNDPLGLNANWQRNVTWFLRHS